MRIFDKLLKALGMLAMVIIMGMMMLTVTEVIMRFTMKRVIFGSTEITEFLMVGLTLAMGWCAMQGRNVSVELIVGRLSERGRAIAATISYIISLGFCVLVAWRNYVEAFVVSHRGELTELLEIPEFPFYFVISLGFAILAAVTVVLLVQAVRKVVSA
jgi:TRAP-type transport system small permease protein